MAKRSAWRESLVETLAAPVMAIAIIVIWQVSVPLLGLSEFVLPTPSLIAKRLVTDFHLLATNSVYTLFEVVAGFGLGGSLPAAAAPVELPVYDRVADAAGLSFIARYSTWDRMPFAPGGDYAVSVHRRRGAG